MSYAQDRDSAFANAMDFAIDKEDFFQLSSSPPPGAAGPASDGTLHQRPPSDFFEQYMVMEMEGVADHPHQQHDGETHNSSGESFVFPPHGDEQVGPGHHFHFDQQQTGLEGGGMFPTAPPSISSATEATGISVTSGASREDSVDMMSIATSIPSVDGAASSSGPGSGPKFPANRPMPSPHQHQGNTFPRQGQQIAGSRPAPDRLAGTIDGRDTANHVVLGHLSSETVEQRRRLLSGRRGLGMRDQPAGGSISDSELLRLEGLSVNSPRGMAGIARRALPSSSGAAARSMTSTSAASPPLADGPSSSSTTDNTNNAATQGRRTPGGHQQASSSVDDIDLCNLANTGGRHTLKAGSQRKLESIYSTIRRAVGSSRGRINDSTTTQHQHPKTTPIPQTLITSHMDSAKKATRRLASENQLMWDGLPISPPLTDMNNPIMHHQNSTDSFVAGLMDDPFFDFGHGEGVLAPAARINGKSTAFNANIPHTPLATPKFKTETCGDDPSPYFPTTTEPWSLAGANFVSSSDMSNPASFLSGDGSGLDTWSFDPSSDSGSNLDFTSATNNNTGGEGGHNNGRNHHNLTIQVPSYVSHPNDPQNTSGSDELAGAGLMIHMPQPRTPNSAPLLSSQIHQTHNGMPLHDASVFPFPEQSPHHQSMHSFRGPYGDQQQHQQQHPTAMAPGSGRRPKPRAPSSGARYHHHLPAGLSPRKTRQPSSSSSSPSPTPGGTRRSRSASRRQQGPSMNNNGGFGPLDGLSHRRSANDLMTVPSSDTQTHAVRKRRSTSSWRGSSHSARRSLSGASSGGMSFGGGGEAIVGGGGISLDGPPGGGAGGGGIGFVNYTPNDHNVLMTGVAPSGSSKTKARREKEAMERQRKLSEAVVKAVTAAGVDVSMLKEEGIVI